MLQFSNAYSSGTESWIGLKPGCKFELSVVSRSKKKNWPSRTMKGPWRVLSVEGSLHIFHFLWPDPNENNYWLYFCIRCNKNGIKGLWGDKSCPHWVQDPPWSFNGPCHCTTIGPAQPQLVSSTCCCYFSNNGVGCNTVLQIIVHLKMKCISLWEIINEVQN